METVTIFFGVDDPQRENATITLEEYRAYKQKRRGTSIVTDVNTKEQLEIESMSCGLRCRCATRLVRRL